MSMEINVFCLAGDGKNIDAIARYRFEFVQNSQRLPRKWNDVVMLHLHVFIGNISFGRVEIDFDFASRGRAVSIDSAQDCYRNTELFVRQPEPAISKAALSGGSEWL
jgi:hypothetical protein